MSASNKALLVLFAVAAFVVGIAVNTARVSDEIDTQALLTAQLLINENSSQEQQTNIRPSLGKLTLVNFWASWCAPCREEMPIFETMYRQSKEIGFTVIGIAIDNPDKAQPMLDSMDISYPIFYAEKTGMQLMESAGNPQGLLPYSLLLDSEGRVLEQVLGRINEQQITAWVARYL